MKKMKKSVLLLVLSLMGGIWTGNIQAENYTVDVLKSSVKWDAKKVTGEHHGTIAITSGTLEVKNSMISGGVVEIDMNSIIDEDLKDPGMNARLVGHLKSDDFFSAGKFPVSKLLLTKVKKLANNEFEITGDLTIKGITNPVTFNAVSSISGKTLEASGTLVINRAKFDVRYGSGTFFSGMGDKLIYDDFTLDFQLEALAK